MVKHHIANARMGLIATGMAALLAGCSGTTYGTGVTTEQQLLDDVTGMIALGGSEKKPRIDYTSRPKLVKAPADGTLPAPAEKTENESAYFPTDPEEKRARLKKLDPTARDDGELGAVRSGPVPATRKYSADVVDSMNRDPTPTQQRAESIEGRAERAKRIAELKGGLRTGAKRRYLTEPPVEYRTPADTAPVGNIGEAEKSSRKKQSESYFDNPLKGIFGS